MNSNKPVVILTTGRSGSTLLQKLMNCNPELMIWGENAGILNHVAACWQMVLNQRWISENVPSGLWLLDRDKNFNSSKWTAWDCPFSKVSFENNLKMFIESIYTAHVPGNVRWGFKEIRNNEIKIVRMLVKLFPGAQFILLARDPVDTCVSMVLSWSDYNKAGTDEERLNLVREASGKISRFYKFTEDLRNELPGVSYKLTYESLVKNMQDTLVNLSSVLAVTDNYNWSHVKDIATTDIMSARKKHEVELQGEIRAVCEDLLVLEKEKYSKDWRETISERLLIEESP